MKTAFYAGEKGKAVALHKIKKLHIMLLHLNLNFDRIKYDCFLKNEFISGTLFCFC
jgi:hypothetical protein